MAQKADSYQVVNIKRAEQVVSIALLSVFWTNSLLVYGRDSTEAVQTVTAKYAENPRMQVKKDAHSGQYLFVDGEKKVLQYNYATVQLPEGYLDKVRAQSRKYAVARSNYIHPLYGMNGEELTLDWSNDHPHHRGIYWAWPEVQYYGKTGDLHALQHVFARPANEVNIRNDRWYAELRAENHWMWEDKTPIVHETTTIRVWASNENGRYIDLTFDFKPLVEGVTLARRKTNAYGGLNIRLSPVRDLKLVHYVDAGDKVKPAWQAATGTWTGGAQATVFAVFEKANNPHYPGDYVEYPHLPWFQPAFPKSKTRFELEEDKPLALRYRIWIRGSQPPAAEEYRREWNAYQNVTTE